MKVNNYLQSDMFHPFSSQSHHHKQPCKDRFINGRQFSDDADNFFAHDWTKEAQQDPSNSLESHQKLVHLHNYSQLLESQLLSHSNKALYNISEYNIKKATNSVLNITSPTKPAERKISQKPYKVLDAPLLEDDFYRHLLDWSSTNIIAVGLRNSVFLWSASNGLIAKLCEIPEEEFVASVSWSEEGNTLAVGTSCGVVQLYDANKGVLTRTFEGHEGRVGSLDWNRNALCSGAKDKTILVRDVRANDDYFCKFKGHKKEICGLKWSYDQNLLASGGNDDKLIVWSLKDQSEVVQISDHKAAVKAIAWSPHQRNVLASGGGTADRCIKLWNINNNAMLNSIDTGSQVCNLMFSKNTDEIVSTHGYSQNEIAVWKNPSLDKVASFSAHTARVLYLSMSPNGQQIVTGAGDESLKLWNVFPSAGSFNDSGKKSLFPTDMDLR